MLTDLNRDKSIFELNPGLKKEVKDSIKKEGSDLSFIKSKCVWKLFDESELVLEVYLIKEIIDIIVEKFLKLIEKFYLLKKIKNLIL